MNKLVNFFKRAIFVLLYLFIVNICDAQWISWVKTGTGDSHSFISGLADMGYSILPSDNGIYLTGLTTGNTVTFEDWETFAPANFIFLIKYTNTGEPLWLKEIPGWGVHEAAEDNNGDILVASYSMFNGWLTKYDRDGNLIWEKEFLETATVQPTMQTVAITDDNSILIGGNFGTSQTLVVGDTTISDLKADRHCFIMKLDASGNFQWISLSDGGHCQFNDITMDSQSNIIATGNVRTNFSPGQTFDDEITFGDFTITSVTDSTNVNFKTWSQDAIVAKFSHDGTPIWVKTIGGQKTDWGNDITTNDQNEIILTGAFADSLIIDNKKIVSHGSLDAMIVKLSPEGSLTWFESAGGIRGTSTLFGPNFDSGRGIETDSDGNIFVSGSFIGESFFGSGQNVIVTGNKEDIIGETGFFAKYSNDGEIQWIEHFSTDQSRIENIRTFDDKIYITGYFFPPTTIINQAPASLRVDTHNFFLAEIGTAPLGLDIAGANLALYPNPTSGFLQIANEEFESEFDVTIFNESGQTVFRKADFSVSDKISISHLTTGNYIVKISIGNIVHTKRIIIK